MIVLEKGQRISLEKNGRELNKVCFGANWGQIEQRSDGFFGIGAGTKKVAVDLDCSVATYTSDKKLVEIVSFSKLKSDDGSIVHSGDDLSGDADGDDGLDNEVITVDLGKVRQDISYVSFFLNSYKQQEFDTIPYIKLRIYEGTPDRVDSVLAGYSVENDKKFIGSVSMILGNLYRNNGKFKFKAVGEPSKSKNIQEIASVDIINYL